MFHCSKKSGEVAPGDLEAAERLLVRWHEADAEMSRQRRAFAVDGVQGNVGGGGQQKWQETRPRECVEGGGQE